MKILVISPHPDDETLGAGGTILKLKEKNNSIHWMIITNWQEKWGFSKNRVLNRKKEIEKIAAMYSFEDVANFNFPDTRLETVPRMDLISRISEYIHSIKPDLILVNNKSDSHTEHIIVFQAVLAATKPYRANFVKKILMYETISETDVLTSSIADAFLPNVFVDISDYMDKKLEMMSIYATEVMEYPLPRSLNSIKALGRLRGSQISVGYAEAFVLVREII